MFDVGIPEIGVILIVAVIVFGPDRLPEFARQAARMLHMLRNFARNAQSDLREELGPEYKDLRLRDLDPRQVVRQHVLEAMKDLDDEDDRRSRKARVLASGERPPYDTEAT